jgi:aminoglycoside/choline kinase family phosphotransferase
MTTNDNADPRLQKLERWIAGLPGPPVERMLLHPPTRASGAISACSAATARRSLWTHRLSARAWTHGWRVVRILAATGVHVPPVIAVDAEQGFVLIGDLGPASLP